MTLGEGTCFDAFFRDPAMTKGLERDRLIERQWRRRASGLTMLLTAQRFTPKPGLT